MASVDDRIVQMNFDNRSFESAVATTMSTLDKLKAALNFGTTKKNGLDDVEASAAKFSMGNVTDQIGQVTQKFSALSVAGVAALATIVSKAVSAGVSVAKAFTLDPIAAGFKNYETQIGAVQTILGNTGLSGADGLNQVNAALDKLNTYANQTVYNFSDMAKNIGTFTAAGVKLQPATDAIKGIANLAALSGSTADQASAAMYQLSQAIASGKVGAQDWISVVNAGIGGKVFQKALFDTGVSLKTIKDVPVGESFEQWSAKGNTFKELMATGAITGDVLTKTLQQFTGDMTDQQLKAQGYTAQQIKDIQTLAQTANNAATKIKTFTQLKDALKEEVATAYGTIFKTAFGDINAATALFSAIHTSVENALTTPIYQLNTLLEAASALGARKNVIDGFSNAFKALGAIIKPIKEAFRQIFPPTTAQEIAGITATFAEFTAKLIPSQTTIDGIRRTFVGLFAALDIGRMIVKGIFSVILPLFGIFKGAGTGVLGFTSNIGDLIVTLDEFLKKGDVIGEFFAKIAVSLDKPIALIQQFRDVVLGFFKDISAPDLSGLSGSFDNLKAAIGPIGDKFDKAKDAVINFAKPLLQELKPALDGIVNLVGQLGNNLATALQSGNFEGILKVIEVGLLGGIFLVVRNFFKKGLSVSLDGGLISTVKESFEGLTGSLKSMQSTLKAATLLEIAAAIALITLSVVALSKIDSDKLQSALQGMAAGFGELLGAMAVLTKISGSAGFIKLPFVAASLILLAVAIDLLTIAVKVLATMSWDELKKGLTGVGVLLAEVTAAAIIISKNSGSMIAAGIGITAMAVAINILALAVRQFGSMDWGTMLKGLAGVGIALVGIAVAMRLMPKGLILQSAGLLLLSIALEAIVGVVKTFSLLDYATMARGIAGVAGSLGAIGIALRLLPKNIALQAAGLVILSGALLLIQKAVVDMAGLSYKTLAKGMGAIAVALGILAGALYLMQGALGGAAALLVAVGALNLLVPVIAKLGGMSWSEIGKGLGVLALALVGIVAAGYAAEGAALGLLAIAAAALALGAGIALAGAGVGALAAGLGVLAKFGAAGLAVLITVIAAVIAQIPAIATAFAVGLINILKVIGDNGPAIIAAFSVIIGSLLTAIITNIPKIVQAAEDIIEAILKVIVDETPNIIAAGLSVLESLLKGIGDNIGQVTAEVATIIVNFLQALTDHLPEIIAAAVNLLVTFLQGITNNISKVTDAAGALMVAMIAGIGSFATKVITAGSDLIINLITGLGQNATKIVTAGTDAIINFISGLGSNAVKLAAAAGQAILDFITGLDAAVVTYEPQIIAAAVKLGVDIVTGIVQGLGGIVSSVTSKLKSGLGSVLSGATSWIPGLGGPAHAIGEPIMNEIGKGIANNTKTVTTALQNGLTESLSKAGETLATMDLPDDNFNPVITPVLDLTNVQKDAAKIPSMFPTKPSFTLDDALGSSYTAARSIASNKYQEAQNQTAAINGTSIAKIEFNQTNTSPESLTPLEIYRLTKNQLAQAKTAIGVP